MCNKVILLFSFLLLVSCINKPVQTNKKISVYDGSMSVAIACIFSPKDCDRVVEEKEWEEVDKSLDK